MSRAPLERPRLWSTPVQEVPTWPILHAPSVGLSCLAANARRAPRRARSAEIVASERQSLGSANTSVRKTPGGGVLSSAPASSNTTALRAAKHVCPARTLHRTPVSSAAIPTASGRGTVPTPRTSSRRGNEHHEDHRPSCGGSRVVNVKRTPSLTRGLVGRSVDGPNAAPAAGVAPTARPDGLTTRPTSGRLDNAADAVTSGSIVTLAATLRTAHPSAPRRTSRPLAGLRPPTSPALVGTPSSNVTAGAANSAEA